jgi:predicted nucleotidyltransferase
MEGEDALSVELDMFGWDVDKALGLLRESNPALLDWLRSPIIYYADEAFYAQLMALARKHFQARALTHHYINMARKHDKLYFEGKGATDEVSLKKYFYIIRPLLSVVWMTAKQEKALPPITFDDLIAGAPVPDAVLPHLSQLVQQKRLGELGKGPRIGELDQWLAELFAIATRYADTFPNGKNDTPIDEFDELLHTVLCTPLADSCE